MLPKRERITDKNRIKGILNRKQYSYSSPTLKIIAEENNGSFPRWVVICPGRLGNAVVRNRIRRAYQAAISRIRRNVAKNIDIVIMPRETKVNCPTLIGLLTGALERLHR
ncbi:MAG: ribonuclease P protein component [Candidatus Saganbacteria bacterium]|nr:ribonuclease P protein component [Candidatus Saganbacteria bacterium]